MRTVTSRVFAASSLAVLFASLVPSFALAQATFTGKVTANQIASGLSVGFWEKKLNCHREADCARRLVRAGGKYVLVMSKGTYGLSDQAKAADFAGQAVTVTGGFDASIKNVVVGSIESYDSSAVSAGLQ